MLETRESHTQKLLRVLSDGKAHPHLELYGLGCMVHSRVAELRKRGHRIETWRESVNGEPTYYYKLAE